MSKEKDIFRQKVYRYQIEGLNDQQIESYNPELAIRSLPPGSYKIMASCTAKDGNWIPSQEVLELTSFLPGIGHGGLFLAVPFLLLPLLLKLSEEL